MWRSLVTAYKIQHTLFLPAASSTQISLLTILAWLLAIRFKLNSKSSRKPFNTPPRTCPLDPLWLPVSLENSLGGCANM